MLVFFMAANLPYPIHTCIYFSPQLTGLAVTGVALAVNVIPDYIPEHVDNAVPLLTPIMCKCHHDDVIKWKHFPRYWPFV